MSCELLGHRWFWHVAWECYECLDCNASISKEEFEKRKRTKKS